MSQETEHASEYDDPLIIAVQQLSDDVSAAVKQNTETVNLNTKQVELVAAMAASVRKRSVASEQQTKDIPAVVHDLRQTMKSLAEEAQMARSANLRLTEALEAIKGRNRLLNWLTWLPAAFLAFIALVAIYDVFLQPDPQAWRYVPLTAADCEARASQGYRLSTDGEWCFRRLQSSQ